MISLIAILIGGVAALFFGNSLLDKFKVNNANKSEDETKQKLAKDDTAINNNNAALAKQEEIRNQLTEDIKKVPDEKDDKPADIIDFFNKRK